MMTRRSNRLFTGKGLPVCSRCGSLLVDRFCGECGESIPLPRGHWFTLELSPSRNRLETVRKLRDRWALRGGTLGEGLTFEVHRAEELKWVKEELLGAARKLTVVGEFGQVLPVDGDVFSCMMGVTESEIRGCMTQLTRPPLCAAYASILPLREEMKTLSLSELLLEAGRRDLAAELLLGVLSESSAKDVRLACPLFGRSLRLSGDEFQQVSGLLADLRLRREQGPVVGLFFSLEGRDASPKIQVARRTWRLPHRIEQKAQGLTAVRLGDGLIVAGLAGTSTPLFLEPGGAVRPIPIPEEFQRFRDLGGSIAYGYKNRVGRKAVGVVLPPDGAGESQTLTVPAMSLDWHDGTFGALLVSRNGVEVARSSVSSSKATSSLWKAAGIDDLAWELRLLSREVCAVFVPSGPLMVLCEEQGYLLGPVRGLARYLGQDTRPREFPAVVEVVAMGQNRMAILSSLGHRLSFCKVRNERDPEANPVTIEREVILPFPATGLRRGDGGTVVVSDSHHFYALASTGPVKPLWQLEHHGRAVRADGFGGVWVTAGGLETVDLDSRSRRLATPEDTARSLSLAWERLGHGLEAGWVADRQGRSPLRSTWGS